jgi:hypothetical protein
VGASHLSTAQCKVFSAATMMLSLNPVACESLNA